MQALLNLLVIDIPQVCGSPYFSFAIRNIILHSMSENRSVEFAEVEFRPEGVRQPFPGIHSQNLESIELDQMHGLRVNAPIDGLVKAVKARMSRRNTMSTRSKQLRRRSSSAAAIIVNLEDILENSDEDSCEMNNSDLETGRMEMEIREII